MKTLIDGVVPFLYYLIDFVGIITIVLVLFYFVLKRFGFVKVGSRIFFGSGLVDSSKKLFNEYPNEIKKETLGEVTGHLLVRLTRVGIFAIIIGLLPSVLLIQQNRLFSIQNKKIEVQTHLLEADRRSSYNFRMGNVFDRIDYEIREQKEELKRKLRVDTIPSEHRFTLSDPLIGRIAALSQALKPYRFMDGDTLTKKAYSPERGQLLIALVKCRLDNVTLHNIYQNVNFTSADLRSVNLKRADLRGADLRGANLRGTNLWRADLKGADLRDADLWGARLWSADLRDANLWGMHLKAVDLTFSDLRGANLIFSDLRGVGLRGADLRGANLWGAYLVGANLVGVNFFDVDLSGVNLKDANSLYRTTGIPDSIKNELLKEKPELFKSFLER